MPPKIYDPDPTFITTSNITHFRNQINKAHNLSLQTYQDLHHFSITRRNDFWLDLWNFLPIKASSQPALGVDESLRIDEFPDFYHGARLNYAENMLSRTGSGIAVKALNEKTLHSPEEYTWDDLKEVVRRYASALRATGFVKGDVTVVIGGSNIVSLGLYLACASIGGIIACFAHDAGERVLADRVGMLKPKLLFTCAKYVYNGKMHDISQRVRKVWDGIERPVGAVVICTDDDDNADYQNDTRNSAHPWTPFKSFLSRDTGQTLLFTPLPFHTPFVVMFSSGTTGTPKGIVHSQGGLILNGMKEHFLHYNHNSTTSHYHYAGIGWTLWNIMLGALFCGSTIVLYDGSPFYPDPETQLKAILDTGVTSFGAGPRYFTELQKRGVVARHWAGKVDKIPSAGALLTESLALWIAESFGKGKCQISTSGGTELCGNFVHGWQGSPVHAGENALICLGMDVDVFLPDGTSAPVGTSGELVCKQAFPNMPVMFLHDPDKKRYRAAYFESFPGVWTHGDFIRKNPETGGLVISGRSDGVLNPSGIRFGSGEIYTIIERETSSSSSSHDGIVLDSICVSQQRPHDPTERVFLFLQTKSGTVSKDLENKIRAAITRDLSRRHVPEYIFPAPKGVIPYNVNGKKLEIPLRAVLSEGKGAFGKRKFTEEERGGLGLYVKFFEVEKVLREKEGEGVKSKL